MSRSHLGTIGEIEIETIIEVIEDDQDRPDTGILDVVNQM